MAKLKVMSVELVAPLSQKDEILALLQRRGDMEIESAEEFPGADAGNSPLAIETDELSGRVSAALGVLSRAAPVKKPLTAMLEPRLELTEESYKEKAAGLPEAYALADEILALDRESAALAAEAVRLQTQAAALEPWKNAEFSAREGKVGRVAFMAGGVRKAVSREEVAAYLAGALPEINCIEIELISSDPEFTAFTAYCLEEDAPEVEQALREYGFLPAPECGGSPRARLEETARALRENEARREEIDSSLTALAGRRAELEFAADALSLRRGHIETAAKAGGTGRVFVVSGWAAEKDALRIKKQVEARFDAAVEVTEPPADADVPVILKNGGLASPLENITGMYSLPGKADIDPTGPMAFFYYFFFGMMLSDAGYGLLIALVTGGVLLFKKNMERRMRNNVKMYFLCGLSTVFWGAMYGSWFGDAPAVIAQSFFGKPAGYNPAPPIWTDAVSDTLNVLIMCFILGLAHLFWGVLMKGCTDIKNGSPLDALFDTVPTFITVIGIAPVFFGLFVQDGIPDDYSRLGTVFWNIFITVHRALSGVWQYILIAGLVLVIATAGRHSKSVGGKIGGGLYAVYSLFSGYLGDVLSYARLLALGMATGVIAQVMNMLGTLPSNPVIKAVMFVPVFIAGHAANMAINLIGAYVHTNRLQYVEFFSKFYGGGGRAFEPFEAKTMFYRFKEEL